MRGGSTYSPKIREDLIPIIYRIGKKESIPMTEVVDRLLRYAIERYTDTGTLMGMGENETAPESYRSRSFLT